MKNILKYTAIAAFALTALSCAKTAEEDFAPAGDPIQFSGSIGNFTKAGDTYFDEGDKIGLYASEPLNLYDVALVAGGNGFLKPEKTIYWTPDAGVVSFTAYYPYGALAPGRKTYFEVYENQSSYGYYTASDVMGALTEAEYPATEVSFTFAHLLSKLSLKIDNIVGKEIASVVLRPVDISANISLEEDVVENAGKYYSEIRLCPVTLADGSDAWICIVPPQTISPTLVVNTTDGLSYTFEVNGEISFTRGCRTDAYVKLDGTSTILNIESIVEDWGWDGEVEFKNPYDDNPSDLPSHTGVRIYVQDQTNWNKLYLYQWGDVNNFGGDWPGLADSGTVAMNGAEYKYFDYSDAVIGLNQNLIFNDGNGSQLADYSMTFERGVSDYFFIITPNGAMRIDDESVCICRRVLRARPAFIQICRRCQQLELDGGRSRSGSFPHAVCR